MSYNLMRLHPYEDIESVGIAVRWDPAYDQVHAGILFRLDDDIKLCHLEFHHKLKLEAPADGYFWADCSMFSGSPERAANGEFFAAWVLDVADNPSIPYGFAFDEHCFDEYGLYRPMELGKGLTCATFIIAVFHSAAIPIIETGTWRPRVEDAEWQRKILGVLTRRATRDHVEAAASYVGHFRYRPEEVAAAAVHAPPPLRFDDCLPLAAEILSTICVK